jgi:hypothetical protein
MFVLRRRAQAHMEAEATERPADFDTLPKREKWFTERGLDISFSGIFPRLAAILGPLMAGPLADLLGRLGK